METQQTITAWGVATFGPNKPLAIATRANVEMSELLNALSNLAETTDPELYEQRRIACGVECADVVIMVMQVSELLGADLLSEINKKMAINRRRKWITLPSGQRQHEDGPNPIGDNEFKEPGSGLIMEMDQWYILADSGSAYYPKGFASSDEALAWAKSPAGVEAGADKAVVPQFVNGHWEEIDGVNIMRGGDLFSFWESDDPEFLNEVQKMRGAV